jgi:hypothetical protein
LGPFAGKLADVTTTRAEGTESVTASAQPPTPVFTRAQQITLRALRARYSVAGDLFDKTELSRLRFVRWLYQTGRLAS